MSNGGKREPLESAISRLPFPVFVVAGKSRLVAINRYAFRIWDAEGLQENQIDVDPQHPLSRVATALLTSELDPDDVVLLELSGTRYEVIHSTRSEGGEERWLILMLRPYPKALHVDRSSLRDRWSLTPREADVAAECLAGRSTSEIADLLSISKETVRTHMARVLAKADCQSRSQLVTRFLFGE